MDIQQVKYMLRQDMVHGIIDRLVLSHNSVLDTIVGQTWVIDGSTFRFDQTQSIYIIRCEGEANFSVNFDIAWHGFASGVQSSPWPAVDTIVVNWDPIPDTVTHLKLLLNIVAHIMVSVPVTKE